MAQGITYFRRFITVFVVVMAVWLMALTAWGSESQQLGTPEKVWWSDVSTAKWKKVEKASQYEVQLRDANDDVVKRAIIKETYIDFMTYMKDGYEYYFEVRALPKNPKKSTWSKGDWVSSERMEAKNIGDVSGRWKSYQDGKKYFADNRNYVTGQWYMVKGKWYYFDNNSYMKTGWQQFKDQWYYLGEDGIMQTGWKQLDGGWYHFKEDGSMTTGWIQVNPNQWHYLNEDGTMAFNTTVEGYPIDVNGISTK